MILRIFIDKAYATSMDEEWVEIVPQSPLTNYDYEVYSPVAVEADHTSDDVFWIDSTSSLALSRQNVVAPVKVPWYDVRNNGACSQVIYY